MTPRYCWIPVHMNCTTRCVYTSSVGFLNRDIAAIITTGKIPKNKVLLMLAMRPQQKVYNSLECTLGAG